MNISIRKIGNTIIEMTVNSNNTTVVEDICVSNGIINEQFIQDLEDIVHELKEHNEIRNFKNI